MKKKLLITLAALIIVLGGGGWYAKKVLTDKIFDQVEVALKDPEIQKQIAELDTDKLQEELKTIDTDKLIAEANGSSAAPSSSPDGKSSSNTAAPSDSSKSTTKPGSSTPKPSTQPDKTPAKDNKPSEGLAFDSRNDAANYAMKKFSASEIVHYMSAYKNKSSMTKEEKQKMKAEILSRFNSAEIKALTEAAK
ncbi:hypothetical protein [Gorillibacterium timonense]|uniref:hypothetical protein n=1 Tax=Gorillibacterium timonense TaxID=1689269 RepID=UPI00071D6C7A|nr:hypothetical protein [Gorillibacterium timonense]